MALPLLAFWKQHPLVTIGDYPAIGLQEARERARKYSQLVANGVSPAERAKEDRGAVKRFDLFKDFADHWYKAEIEKKSQSYATTTRRALDKDILPIVGNKPLSAVSPSDVLVICDKIKGRGALQSALVTRNIIKRLYEYAIARQLAAVNPAQQIVARYIATLQSRTRVLTPKEIGQVLRAIYASNISRHYKLALHLLSISMVRKSELIEAEWKEIDFEAAIWRIPAERMKKDKEHWVPLSHQALEMFKELKTLSSSEKYVFPMRRGYEDRPISKSTLNQAVRAMKIEVKDFVLHDFRRTASTHLHEMGHSSDAIEKALAHTMKGVKGIYNRAEYGEERKKYFNAGRILWMPRSRKDRKFWSGGLQKPLNTNG